MPFGGDRWRCVAQGTALSLPQLAPVFAIGNGFVGVRGPGDLPLAPRVYLNGVYERVPIAYHEAAFGYARVSDTRLAVADATRPLITVDGKPVATIEQVELDMARGCRVETYRDHNIVITVEALASMERPGIVLTRVSLPTADLTRVKVSATVTPPPAAAAAETQAMDAPYDPRVSPALARSPWQEVTTYATVEAAGRVDRLAHGGMQVAALAAMLPLVQGGGQTTIDIVTSYAATQDDGALAAAEAQLAEAAAAGAAVLAQEQADWFARYWRATSTAFPADSRTEMAIRHAQFQLAQAVARDGRGSIAAKGQTGEGYEGHVFWDADLYVLPVFAFTQPDIARGMLAWRIAGLDAARDNARAMGQARGALYPWRTIGGHECSSFFPAGSAQYHINADIAFALETYLAATDDQSILADGGAEMLVETARIWLEIGFHDPARGEAFVINRVTGPDEYSAIVDNNLYTNMMAARHLRFAARVGGAARLIDADEAARMQHAADQMFLPFDQERDIFLQDQDFFGKQPWPFDATPASNYPLLLHYHPLHIYRHQVAKQADAVLAVALMPEQFAPDIRRRMLDAYEAVTVHDSTLSASAFAIAAAGIGDADRAAAYWRVAALTDLCDLFGNTGHGLHMAALAGSWSAIAMGFAGMRVDGATLVFDPQPIPGVGPYGLTIAFRGSVIAIAVNDGEVEYRLVEGPPVSLRHCQQHIRLSDTAILTAEVA